MAPAIETTKLQLALFRPQGDYKNPNAFYQKWARHPTQDAFIQGEINEKGQLDGLNLRITPHKQIQIVQYKNDKRHGACTTVFKSGVVWHARYKNGVLRGAIDKISSMATEIG